MAKRHFRKTRRSPRRWFRRRGHKSKKIPLAPLIGLVSMFTTNGYSGRSIYDDIRDGNFENAGYDLREKFACSDSNGKFRVDWIIPNYGPLIGGIVIHYIVQKLGGNKYFDKIPFVGKYLAI